MPLPTATHACVCQADSAPTAQVCLEPHRTQMRFGSRCALLISYSIRYITQALPRSFGRRKPCLFTLHTENLSGAFPPLASILPVAYRPLELPGQTRA